jgi:hypothetical protein
MALHGLTLLQEALETYEAGLLVDPNNDILKSGMELVI